MRNNGLSSEVVASIKCALCLGYYQHDIAAYYHINQGRVSEIKTGKRWQRTEPADQLPDDFPLLG